MPSPSEPTLRGHLRLAIERAWAAAIAAGRAAAPSTGAETPVVRSSGRRTRITAMLATNLALKLARPYRRAPLEIATVLAGDSPGTRSRAGARRCSRRSTWRRPGSSTSGSPIDALAGGR